MDTLLLTEVLSLFRFPYFFPNVLFLFHDPIQDMTWYLVIISPWVPLGCESFSHFLVLDELDSSEEDWSGVV